MTSVPQSGLPWQVLSAWGDLRASYRGLMASRPTEGKLLFIAMASGFVWFLQWVMLFRLSGDAALMQEQEVFSRVAAQLVAALLFRTLMLYLTAAIFTLVLRRFGGMGGWVETRAAVFWAFLVVAPVLLLLAGIGQVVTAGLPDLARGLYDQIGSLLLAYVLAVLLAEAHGFRRAWIVFAGIVIVSVGTIALAGALGHMV
ncbi:hypothetical protein KHP62_05355 [Rhodobacteraceae bacterium NNCM2]|nr:hypothetical protein [Coraliihabitans acroporae]